MSTAPTPSKPADSKTPVAAAPSTPASTPAKTDDKPKAEPEHIMTTAEEQLARSAEIETLGVEKWRKKHDMHVPEDQPKAVAGVSPTVKDETGHK